MLAAWPFTPTVKVTGPSVDWSALAGTTNVNDVGWTPVTCAEALPTVTLTADALAPKPEPAKTIS